MGAPQSHSIEQNSHPTIVSRSRQFLPVYRAHLQNIVQAALCWEILLASAVLAGVLGIGGYLLFDGAQRYSELLPGAIAWSNTAKTCDYALLLFFVGGYFSGLLILGGLAEWIRKRCGNGPEKAYRTLLAYASLPAVLWIAGLALADYRSFHSLYLAAALVLLVVRNSYRATRRYPQIAYGTFLDSVGAATLVPILFLFSGYAATLGLSHLNSAFPLPKRPIVIPCFLAILGWLLTEMNWMEATAKLGDRITRWRLLLVSAQLPLPLFFLTMLPTSLTGEGRIVLDPAVNWLFPTVAAVLVGVTYIDILRRIRSKPRAMYLAPTALSVLSPAAFMALVLLVKTIEQNIGIGWDSYHFGEFVLPWWLTAKFGYIPFWDYMPARGLVNYAPGLLASLLMDGSAPSHHAVQPLLQLLFMAVTFLPISRTVGLFPAFLMFLLMPTASGWCEIQMVLTAALCFVGERFLRSEPSWWLLLWALLCVAVILFAPGQGCLWTLATTPLAIAAMYRLVFRSSTRTWLAPSLVLGACAGLAVITPLGKMFFGAIRYVSEQGYVNSEAYGTAWRTSWEGTFTSKTSTVLFELIRTSFVGVGIVAGIILLRGLAMCQDNLRGRRMLIYAVPICLLMVLFIPRAVGRIQPGGASRQGIASIWALAMLLPLLLWTTWPKRRRALAAVLVVLCGGTVAPFFGMSDLKVMLAYRKDTGNRSDVLLGHRTPTTDAIPEERIVGDELGMPNLGRARVTLAELDKLKSIGATLRQLVRPGETYLDLTNQSARYFYLGYPPPIEGAIYNLPTESQQLRAIDRLEANPPPVVLAWTDDNTAHDGSLASLRAHLLYRYLVSRYKPVMLEQCIFLVAPSRLVESGVDSILSLQPFDWTDRVWSHGIWRENRAGFHTYSPKNLKDIIRPGQTLVFANSGARRVEAIEGPIVWLVGEPLDPERDGYPATVKAPDTTMGGGCDRLLLDMAFRHTDLGVLPIAWGRSFDSLKARLRSVVRLSNPSKRSSGSYPLTGTSPAISFDLTGQNLSGKEAGILVFDVEGSRKDSEATLEVAWRGDDEKATKHTTVQLKLENGKVIVPLDAAPRWLLCSRLQQLTITGLNLLPEECVSIRNVELFQRRVIEDMPKAKGNRPPLQ